MSLKWTGSQSESGILRKSELKEKKEDLFVFGYSCKLFRDDDRALLIDQGKHLIPWMGDETLKIDRYDARGALHDLSALEAPPGGFDWRVELTKTEKDVELLCDEERYRALHTDEDEEEMYKEEELKRLHAAGYGQVGFTYDAPPQPSLSSQPAEVDEPFLPTPAFKALLPSDIIIPESLKQNAIIEKTAKFIATQGVQMEILIKAKQGDNPQFQFLNKESPLHLYYTVYINLVKTGKWPEKKIEVVEEKFHENEDYLHPSLASAIIESAPAIPSIHYRPSADCDYMLLINKMRGEGEDVASADVPPPGTELAAPPAVIYRAPVLYTKGPQRYDHTSQPAHSVQHQHMAYYQPYTTQPPAQPQQKPGQEPATSLKSTGLSLMKNYNTDSDSDVSDFDDSSSTDSKDKPSIVKPPEDVQIVIDKMASYVARNGDEFAEIVRAKNDPRFTFLDPDHIYHAYYKRLMQQKRGIEVNGKEKPRQTSSAPVSFSIKKQKEPDPILPKPALPYETSSDEESEKQKDNPVENQVEIKEVPKLQLQTYPINHIPPIVVYKMDGQLTKDLPTIKTIEPDKIGKPITNSVPEVIKEEEIVVTVPVSSVKAIEEEINATTTENVDNNSMDQNEIPQTKENSYKRVSPEKRESPRRRESPHRKESSHKRESPQQRESPQRRDSPYIREVPYRREKRKNKDRKKDYRSRSESRERRNERRSIERGKRREKENDRDRKKTKHIRDELEAEIISLEDNSDDLIDLTGDQSDTKGDSSPEADRSKQQARRRRAAEFLRRVGVDPTAATALPTTSLASAMVDTLESLRKKKAAEEEKRRRREKRSRRERRDYDDDMERSHRKSKRRKNRSSDDDDGSDHQSLKKKKRKKDKKHTSKDKNKRKQEADDEEEDQPLPVNINLTNTLKELRTSSPTKDLVLQDLDNTQKDRQASSDEEFASDRKRKREYSEGEWSSDSEVDSNSSVSARDD